MDPNSFGGERYFLFSMLYPIKTIRISFGGLFFKLDILLKNLLSY